MPSLIVAGTLFAVGLIAVISQVFRTQPNGWVLVAGAALAIFGALEFSDNWWGDNR